MIEMIYKQRMQELRIANSLTQNDLAHDLNLGRSAFSQYEEEYVIMPIKHLISFCDYFNVSLDYIFGLSDLKSYSNMKTGVDMQLVSNNLKEFRKEQHLTQVKLASILNIGKGTIADYERGRYLIATPFLYDICKRYKISADYLIGRIDNPKYLK